MKYIDKLLDDIGELYIAVHARLVAEILLSILRDLVKERLDPSEWKYLDINTIACILDQLNCEDASLRP